MWYLYQVADIRVLCQTPFPVTIQRESAAFLTPLAGDQLPEDVDLTLKLEPVDALDEDWTGAVHVGSRYYWNTPESSRVYFCILPDLPPYACIRWEGTHAVCRYLSDRESDVNLSKNITEFLCLETLLLRFDSLLLHASFIRWNGIGILFSAPCGTGKSTQAALWEQFLGADTLNGDRAAIRFADGKWTAWGLPYAGTSGIYRNESAPLRAIVTLSQGPENVISPLTPMQAVRRLLPELNMRRWDADAVNHVMDLLTVLVQQIPIYHLSCRPDQDAVLLLRDTLEKERTQ